MAYPLAEDNRDRSAFALLLTIEDPDTLIRRAVEVARDVIGLVRVSIYVRDQGRHFMTGTWASDSSGAILDEHHVVYATNKIDETFLPDEEGALYSVFDDCLIVDHGLPGTATAGRAWVTCTPIRRGPSVIGLMFNDAGPKQAAFDEAKQARAAILCSLLGTVLGSLAGGRLPTHRLVMAAVGMLVQDPGMELEQIAQQLGVGLRRLDRRFRADVGTSFADYRNRLRLDRVAFLIAKGRTSLADAAIAAGFESHAQFKRVSRAFLWRGKLQRPATSPASDP
jgi:AraC-like DNA-binding protein